ncbi:MAG: SDR family oxidoreductase, partial [Deltaproteobacteria bacterium]|nr:SDR family oxidoreductase [Deltaproteobacteria bacterium]
GKVALVLGAIKGIGKGIGLALAREGVKVVLNYYDWEESLEQMKQDFEEAGADYLVVRTNLLDTDKISSLVENVIARFGRLDILINNIERGGWPVVHGPYVREQWDLEMATTLRAKWWIYNSALPYLKASGDGVVVNISSIAGFIGRTGPAGRVFNDGYAAANRAVSSFTETWAREAAPEVRVNEVMLGFFETRHGPQTRGWGLLSEVQRNEIIDHTLLRRIGTIEDVIKAVLFVIRDAPFMTGSILRLDGGYLLGGEYSEPMPRGVEPV